MKRDNLSANIFRLLAVSVLLCVGLSSSSAFAQRRNSAAVTNAKSITVRTEPNAIIWLDEIRRGTTDAAGKLTLTSIAPGRHTLRVRAAGFKETTMPLLPAQRGLISVRLLRTTDEAELLFQQAEVAREKARDDASRESAAEAYRRALKLRPNFPAARVGLARVLMDLNQYRDALAEIEEARNLRPIYPEASAVEGRIQHEFGYDEQAIEAFRRSIREARGFQPEAHTGLARILEERGENEEAIAEYRTAIQQLSDSEPALYQLIGALYEKMQRYKEAVAAYDKYLQLAPNGSFASAVRSIIDQLRQEATALETKPIP